MKFVWSSGLISRLINKMSSTKTMGITKSNLQAKLNEAIQFLDHYLPLANCHMVEFITDNLWEKLTPTDIKDDVKSSKECNVNKVFDETFRSIFDSTLSSSTSSQADKMPGEHFPSLVTFLTTARDACFSCLSDMISWQELQEKLIALGSDSHQSLYLDQFMTGKKAHEVEVMSQVVASLANVSQVSHIVDVGNGKGYLSSMLALHHGLSVLGIDSSQSTSHGAVKRTKKLVRAWNGITKKEGLVSGLSYRQKMYHEAGMLSSQSSMNEPSPSALKGSAVEKCKYKQATLFVTPHMNLLDLVESYFPESCGQHDQLALVGLHTCGDLAPTALRILASSDHVSGLCNVGCCYHLLSEQFVSDDNKIASGPIKDYGFPMSDFLRSREYVLGRNARMLAAQSLDRIVNTRNSHHWTPCTIGLSSKCCSKKSLEVKCHSGTSVDWQPSAVIFPNTSTKPLVSSDWTLRFPRKRLKDFMQSMSEIRSTYRHFLHCDLCWPHLLKASSYLTDFYFFSSKT